MVRMIGLIGVVLVTGVPVLILPEVHLAVVSAVLAAMGASALFIPSLGLATFSGVAALLTFSVALLVSSPSGGAWAGVIIGIGLLVLLDAVHYQQRFRKSTVEAVVGRGCLASLGAAVLLSVAAAIVLTSLAQILAFDLDAVSRSIVAGGGSLALIVGLTIGIASARRSKPIP